MSKPSVFISYAHKDGLDFTRRLSYALTMYMDVFWDRRLQTGPFPEQLEREIERCEYFLFVMTPYSLQSEWCKRELEHALQNHKEEKIAIARVFRGEGTSDSSLTSTYTYGDFTEDFDSGFRRLTQMILGEPYSSWEYLDTLPDAELLDTVEKGFLPAIISRNLAEWLIVEKLYTELESSISTHYQSDFESINPRTAEGVWRVSDGMIKEAHRENNIAVVKSAEDVKDIVDEYLLAIDDTYDTDNEILGGICYSMIRKVKEYLILLAKFEKDGIKKTLYIESYFDFSVAERLRELIQMYARRSKYLY